MRVGAYANVNSILVRLCNLTRVHILHSHTTLLSITVPEVYGDMLKVIGRTKRGTFVSMSAKQQQAVAAGSTSFDMVFPNHTKSVDGHNEVT